MRNKSELLWIGLLVIMIAGAFHFHQSTLASSRPIIGETTFKIEKSWPDSNDSRWTYSFLVRGNSSGANFEAVLANDDDGRRKARRLPVRPELQCLAKDDDGRRKARATGHLPEAQCRALFGGLESAGVRKLVSLSPTSYGPGCVHSSGFDRGWEHVRISIQAGDWRNDVNFYVRSSYRGPEVQSPIRPESGLHESFLRYLDTTVVGTQEHTLTETLARQR